MTTFLPVAIASLMHAYALQFEALSVADRMQSIATTLPTGVTKSLLHTFKVCGQCTSFVRLGEAHDGGYLACEDGLSGEHIQAAYSIGVEGHDKWSLDIYNLLNVPVHQFDCTVSRGQECPACVFHQKCLQAPSGAGAVSGRENLDLWQALNESGYGQAPQRSLVMKMDIEASEWPLLAEMSPGGAGEVLQKFQQVILEFHWMDQKHKHGEYLRAMQNVLAAGFRVAHVHGNNFGGMYYEGEYGIPNVVEVTFISTGQPHSRCQDPQRSPLDMPNNPGASELPQAPLP